MKKTQEFKINGKQVIIRYAYNKNIEYVISKSMQVGNKKLSASQVEKLICSKSIYNTDEEEWIKDTWDCTDQFWFYSNQGMNEFNLTEEECKIKYLLWIKKAMEVVEKYGKVIA